MLITADDNTYCPLVHKTCKRSRKWLIITAFSFHFSTAEHITSKTSFRCNESLNRAIIQLQAGKKCYLERGKLAFNKIRASSKTATSALYWSNFLHPTFPPLLTLTNKQVTTVSTSNMFNSILKTVLKSAQNLHTDQPPIK